MIIGRDFLKKNSVQINHANDMLTIEGDDVHVNTVNAIGSEWLDVDMRTELNVDMHADCMSVDLVESPRVAKVCDDTILRTRSQCLVEVKYFPTTVSETEYLLFEPTTPMPTYCLVGRSAHTCCDDKKVWCNVMNTGPTDVTLKSGHALGTLSEIDAANIKFDEDMANFVPLDIAKIRLMADTFNFNPSSKLNGMFTNDKLTHIQKCMLQIVLSMHTDVFQWDKTTLGRTMLVEHCVPTGDSKPVQQKQYPIPTVAMQEVRKQTAQMLADKVIRPSKSPWRSPVLLVKKKDSGGKVTGYRFCIDLTKVNAVTIKDTYTLPVIGSTVDTMSGATFFSNGDLNRAFWQVGLAEADKEKYSFVVDGKIHEPNVMPFGSINAPSTFQRLVDRVLNGLTWKQCLVYLDDVLIFSSTFDQHICDIHETLSRFTFANLRLKPSKCNFAKAEVDYLGFNISGLGIRANDKRLESMAKINPPVTTKLLFSFLCSMTYYRKNIPHYGELTVVLCDLANTKRRLVEWTPSALKSFEVLKQAFIQAPILIFPDYNKPFDVQTDASDKGMSCVLLQMKNERLHPVALDGRKFTPTEMRYSATEREMLAIIYAYTQFYHHIYGRHINFYTDYKPLVTMNKLSKPFGRLGRMFHKLSGVDYTMHYIPGSENYLADFLSRQFDPESKTAMLNNIML